MRERTKFNVAKNTAGRTYDNIVFDSALEMRYYRDVVLPRLESGEITECRRQVPYILQPSFKRNGKTIRQIQYVADFVTVDKNGHMVVIDVKGQADAVAKLKRKLFWHAYPEIDYIWVTYVKKYGGWIDYGECQKLRRKKTEVK